ncbi:protein containg FOG: FHA domain [Longilinea arvoryzae]|uniref:Protein containg FOG: FHA domain n=1 Tax=Longilinea arvoryzae TaxID=360412 RepID=A0A0S7BHV4_9CHLR|nr:FHA domain-containing protein [Longilinea arvoryzae]GAP15177.1 protein containg FOG: FHA domain [Longilinea arvoryzae]
MIVYRLVMRSGPNAGQVYSLEKNEVFIGRDLANDIIVNDPEVSRRHLRLFLQGNQYCAEDLGSTNGSFVNGQRLAGPFNLQSGEFLTLGERINFAYEVVDTDATVVSLAAQPRQEQPPVAPAAHIPPPPPPFSTPEYQPAQPANVYEPVLPPDQGSWLDQAESGNPNLYQQQAPIPESGDYSGQIPQQPAAPAPSLFKRKLPNWALITIIVVAALVFLCLIFVVVDALNLYCSVFPKLVNVFVPGYCR